MARPGSPCSRARRSASVRHRLLSALLLRHAQRDGLRRCVLDATRLPSDALTLPLHPSLARAVRLKDPDRPAARGALQGHSRTRRGRQVRSDGHEPRRHLDGHAPQDAVQPVRPSPEWSSRAGASLLKLIESAGNRPPSDAQQRAEPRRDDQPDSRGRRARVPRQGGASARPGLPRRS